MSVDPTTAEKFLKSHRAAVEEARKIINEEKGDPEKQKTCPHLDFIGDMQMGPCVCSDCNAVILE